MAHAESIDSSSSKAMDQHSKTCSFLLECKERKQILPPSLQSLLIGHDQNEIILRHGTTEWPITIEKNMLGAGWKEYFVDNITQRNHLLLLRHSGNFVFDVIHFCEVQKQIYMPWTSPLPNILQQQLLCGSSDPADQIIRREKVTSSLKPDLVQDLCGSVCFYQIFRKKYRSRLKIPRFVDYFVNEAKSPSVILRTGRKTIEVSMSQSHFTDNWETFVHEHHLRENEILVFIPESTNCFTVQIFSEYGDEKILPWYNRFSIFYNPTTNCS